MLISKTRTGPTCVMMMLLDTGTTACLVSEKIAKENKLTIREAEHLTLKGANGEDMVVRGTTTLYLDMFEGSEPRKSIQAIVSTDLDHQPEGLDCSIPTPHRLATL